MNKTKLLLFLLSPFLSLINTIYDLKNRQSLTFLFLFCVVFGYSFVVGDDIESIGLDGAVYRSMFEEYVRHNNTLSSFLESFSLFFTFDSKQDFYADIIMFITSLFSNNYHFFFMLLSIIFAYFQVQSLKFLIYDDQFRISFYCMAITYLFLFVSIFNVNGFRFWTAYWIGIYCIFQIFINENKKYLLLAFCTPIIHLSFVLFDLFLLLSIIVKNQRFWIVAFISSFFFSSMLVDLTGSLSNIVPPIFQRFVDSYTSEKAMSNFHDRSEWGTGAYLMFLGTKWYINFLVFLLVKRLRDYKDDKKLRKLLILLLVCITFANFFALIPSLGNRFIIITYPLVAYLSLRFFNSRRYKYTIYLIPLIFSVNIVNSLNLYSMVLEPCFYFCSPIYLAFRYLF